MTFNFSRMLAAGILLSLIACQSANQKEDGQPAIQTDLVKTLILAKTHTDALIASGKDSVLVFEKMPGSPAPVPVVAKEPGGPLAERYFYLHHDSSGRLAAAIEVPVSESGDWMIKLTHYFSPDGKTYAFERKAEFYNSICTPGKAFETTTQFFDPAFQLVEKNLQFTDEKNNELVRDSCQFPYNYPFRIYPTSRTFFDSTGVKLAGK